MHDQCLSGVAGSFFYTIVCSVSVRHPPHCIHHTTFTPNRPLTEMFSAPHYICYGNKAYYVRYCKGSWALKRGMECLCKFSATLPNSSHVKCYWVSMYHTASVLTHSTTYLIPNMVAGTNNITAEKSIIINYRKSMQPFRLCVVPY